MGWQARKVGMASQAGRGGGWRYGEPEWGQGVWGQLPPPHHRQLPSPICTTRVVMSLAARGMAWGEPKVSMAGMAGMSSVAGRGGRASGTRGPAQGS